MSRLLRTEGSLTSSAFYQHLLSGEPGRQHRGRSELWDRYSHGGGRVRVLYSATCMQVTGFLDTETSASPPLRMGPA